MGNSIKQRTQKKRLSKTSQKIDDWLKDSKREHITIVRCIIIGLTNSLSINHANNVRKYFNYDNYIKYQNINNQKDELLCCGFIRLLSIAFNVDLNRKNIIDVVNEYIGTLCINIKTNQPQSFQCSIKNSNINFMFYEYQSFKGIKRWIDNIPDINSFVYCVNVSLLDNNYLSVYTIYYIYIFYTFLCYKHGMLSS